MLLPVHQPTLDRDQALSKLTASSVLEQNLDFKAVVIPRLTNVDILMMLVFHALVRTV